MSQSDASSFRKDNEFTQEEMEQNKEENPFQFGTKERKDKSAQNKSDASAQRGGYFADQAAQKWKEQQKREDIAGETTPMPGADPKAREQAGMNYKETGEVSTEGREGYKSPEANAERAQELEDKDHEKYLESLRNIDTSDIVENAKNKKDRVYDPEKEPEAEKPEEAEEFKVDDGRKAAWGRTLRDIGVAGLDVGSSLLQAAEKQYGAVVKLTQQMIQGKPMSLPSQALTATMTGLGTVNEVAEDAAQKLGVKPGVDPEKLRDQLAIKGPEYYRQKDLAQRATQYVTKEFNDAVEEAAAGKDLTQLTDTELEQVYNRMERTFRPEYDRIVSTPQDQWTQSDRVFYNSYVAMNNGIGRRAKAIGREQRAQMRDLKQQQKDDQEFLNQNRSAWYRSGEMKDPKDVSAYKRELEKKMDMGAQLTPEEEDDYDDIVVTYGWNASVRTLAGDMLRKPHRVPLWTQKAGTKLSKNVGGDLEVMKMYQLARKGDISALKAMLDTPEKQAAAMGFARMAIANQSDPNLRTRFPMSNDDIVLGYAINSAISGEKFAPPVKPARKMGVPKWMRDKQAAEKAAQAKNQAAQTKKQAKIAQKPPVSPQKQAKPAQKQQKQAQKVAVKRKKTPSGATVIQTVTPPVVLAAAPPAQTGTIPYSEGLKYTMESGGSDYLLNKQKEDLRRLLSTMDKTDPDYARVNNLKNQADAEHFLYHLVSKGAPEQQVELAKKILGEYREGRNAIDLASKGGTPAQQRRALFTPVKRARRTPVGAVGGEKPLETQEEAVQEPVETIGDRIHNYKAGLDDFKDRVKKLKVDHDQQVLSYDISQKIKEIKDLKEEALKEGYDENSKEISYLNDKMSSLGTLYDDVMAWSPKKEVPPVDEKESEEEVPVEEEGSPKEEPVVEGKKGETLEEEVDRKEREIARRKKEKELRDNLGKWYTDTGLDILKKIREDYQVDRTKGDKQVFGTEGTKQALGAFKQYYEKLMAEYDEGLKEAGVDEENRKKILNRYSNLGGEIDAFINNLGSDKVPDEDKETGDVPPHKTTDTSKGSEYFRIKYGNKKATDAEIENYRDMFLSNNMSEFASRFVSQKMGTYKQGEDLYKRLMNSPLVGNDGRKILSKKQGADLRKLHKN